MTEGLETSAQGSGSTNSSQDDKTPVSPSSLSKGKDITNQILQFLSTASNETLIGCLLALSATTYLVLGRIGLVLIGVVGGVVLHATWESNTQSGVYEFRAAETKRRREVGLDVVHRVLNWRDKKESKNADHGSNEKDKDGAVSTRQELNFADFQPATGAALSSLVDAVIRDYVKWWYAPILPSETSFPAACRHILTGFLLSISSHLSRKRPADTFLNFLTNASSIAIVFLNELSNALMAPGLSDLGTHTAVHLYLEENPESSLAIVLDMDHQQTKLKALAEDILQTFLDTKSYNCEPVKIFLREILAGVIFESMVKSFSKPEWINSWIVYLLEEGEPDLMNAIDAGVGGASVKELKSAAAQQEFNHASAQLNVAQDTMLHPKQALSNHQRKVSRAEDAMQEAMQEAKRLSEMIASEDAKNKSTSEDAASSGNETEALITPTSSQSDLQQNASTSLQSLLEKENETPSDKSLREVAEAPSNLTTFDQILKSVSPTATQSDLGTLRSRGPLPLTLHNATVSILDDTQPGEKANIRSKPTAEFYLQVEPASSQHPGWIIARRYADFETLHEVLRRISVISGVAAFSNKYSAIPNWKSQTKSSLRTGLEKYLRDALSYSRLAESEGMKRFLERDQGVSRPAVGSNKGLLGFPSPAAFETMGKGMLDVLTSAPKGASGGGKALIDGVSGVFGVQKKPISPARPSGASRSGSISNVTHTHDDALAPGSLGKWQSRESQDSLRGPGLASVDEVQLPPLPRRPGVSEHAFQERSRRGSISSEVDSMNASISLRDGLEGHNSTLYETTSVPAQMDPLLNLPPPPSEIPDDYSSVNNSPRTSMSITNLSTYRTSTSTAPPSVRSPSIKDATPLAPDTPDSKLSSPIPVVPNGDYIEEGNLRPNKLIRDVPAPLTEQETQVAVELFFAVINELYTLSSAWNIRRTLLNAAKTFLLRPGNPNLEAIRVLLQQTVLEANTSDIGIATHLMKLRENSLPTEEELATWPPPQSSEEKEKLRVKARKLLVEKGMPQALTSVMGAYASGEALGRVFDSLQIEEVARGFMLALLLQGVQAVTQ